MITKSIKEVLQQFPAGTPAREAGDAMPLVVEGWAILRRDGRLQKTSTLVSGSIIEVHTSEADARFVNRTAYHNAGFSVVKVTITGVE